VRTYNPNFFNSAVYFVEKCMLGNQNAHNNRAQGMSSHVRVFFQGCKQMAKKESGKEESNQEENCKEEKIGLRIVHVQFESRYSLAAFYFLLIQICVTIFGQENAMFKIAFWTSRSFLINSTKTLVSSSLPCSIVTKR